MPRKRPRKSKRGKSKKAKPTPCPGVNLLLEHNYDDVIACLEYLAPILKEIDDPDESLVTIPTKDKVNAKKLLPPITRSTFSKLKTRYAPGTDSSGAKCLRILPHGLRSLYSSDKVPDKVLCRRASWFDKKVQENWNRRHRQIWINTFLPQVHRSKHACEAAAFATFKAPLVDTAAVRAAASSDPLLFTFLIFFPFCLSSSLRLLRNFLFLLGKTVSHNSFTRFKGT